MTIDDAHARAIARKILGAKRLPFGLGPGTCLAPGGRPLCRKPVKAPSERLCERHLKTVPAEYRPIDGETFAANEQRDRRALWFCWASRRNLRNAPLFREQEDAR